MQDLRTVVLLRRRMNESGHRKEPWIPVGRSTGGRLPFLRRSLQSHIRMPLGSLLVLGFLAVAAGSAFAGASHGPAALALLPAPVLFVAAYFFLEPLAQEVDHPLRWEEHPVRPGHVIRGLTEAGAAFMVPLGALAALVAVPMWSRSAPMVTLAVLPIGAVGATAGAAVSTMMSDVSSIASNPLQSEVFGLYVAMRIVLPLLPALLPFVPPTAVLAGAAEPGTVLTTSMLYTVAASGIAWWWLGSKEPERI